MYFCMKCVVIICMSQCLEVIVFTRLMSALCLNTLRCICCCFRAASMLSPVAQVAEVSGKLGTPDQGQAGPVFWPSSGLHSRLLQREYSRWANRSQVQGTLGPNEYTLHVRETQ